MSLTFQERYTRLLERYLLGGGEEPLEEAYQLGKEMMSAGLGVGDVGELHAHALAELAEKHPDDPIGQERSHLPLLETLMPCELMLKARAEWLDEQASTLRESEENYRLLAEISPIGIFRTDAQGQTTYVNPRWSEISGLAADEALGDGWLRAVHPDDRAWLLADWQEAVGTNVPSTAEYRFLRPDGTVVWVMGQATPEGDEQGRLAGYVGTITDITDLKQATEEARRRSEETAALLEISQALNRLDLEAILQVASEQDKALFAADGCRVFLLEPDGETLRCVLALHDRAEAVLGIQLKLGQGVTGAVAADGEPTIVNDMLNDPRTRQVPGTPVEQEAMMFVPLEERDRLLGVMSVSRLGDERPFQPADLELFKALAAMVTSAIANARLFEAEHTARQQAERLLAASQALGATLDLQETFDRILSELRHVVPYDSASVQLLKGDRLEIIGGHGFPNLEELLGVGFDLTADDNPNCQVIHDRAPFVLEDAPTQYATFNCEPHAQAGIRSWLGAPLLYGERIIGIIALDKREPGFFTAAHAHLAQAFAAQAAIAIENARLYDEARRAAERREVLHRASQEIARSVDDPEQVYQAIHQAAAQLMPTEAFVIALRDEARNENEAVYLFDKGGRWPSRRIPAGQGLSGQVIASGQPLLIDGFTPETMPRAIHFGEPESVRAILAVPLRLGERVIGMISAQSYQVRAYTAEEQALLEMLAAHAAAALENARLFAETTRRAERLASLNRIGLAISAGLDLDAVLNALYEQTQSVLQADAFYVALYDEESGLVHFPLLTGKAGPRQIEPLHIEEQPGLTGHVIRSGRTLYVPDTWSVPPDAPYAPIPLTEDPARSYLGAPLNLRGQVAGVLSVQSGEPNAYSAEDIELLTTIAVQAAIALQNARLFEQIRQRLDEMAVLYDTASALSASLDVDAIAEIAAHQIVTILVAEGCAFSLWDEARDALVVLLDYVPDTGLWTAAAPGTVYPLADYPASRQVLTTRQPLTVRQGDPAADPGELAWMQEEKVQSLLMVPLVAHDRTIGLLEVMETRSDRTFTPVEITLCQTMAAQAAIALENARLYNEVQRRVLELTALHETALDITAQLDRTEVLNAIIARACDLLHATGGLIHLYDPAQDKLVAMTSYRLEKDYTGLSLERGEGVAGKVFQCGEPLVLADHRAWDGQSPQVADAQARAMLAVPLTWQGQTIGVLDVMDNERVGVFDEGDLRLLLPFATQAAIAIQNARLYETEQRRAREAAAVSAMAQALNATTDLKSVFQVVARHLTRVVEFDRLSIALIGDGEDHFTIYALAAQEEAPLPPGMTLPLAATAAAGDVLAGRPHLTPDLSTEQDFAAERVLYESGLRSRLNLPIVLGNEIIGALNLASFLPRAFSTDHLPLLEQVAAAVAAAVQNARLFEETRRRNRELALLNRVIAASASGRSVEAVLEIVCRELARYFDVPQAAAALFDEEQTQAAVVAEYLAEGRPSALGAVIPVADNPSTQYLLQHKAPLAVENAQTDPRLAPIHDLMRRRGTVSLLIVPLLVEEKVVGSLGLDAIELRPFRAEEVALARRVAEQVSGVVARARLAEIQRRLSTAVEQAADAVVITDPEGIILYVNPAFERIMGYPLAEIVGQPMRFLASGRHEPDFYKAMIQTIRAGQVWQGRIMHIRQDGSEAITDATISPVRDEEGRIVNYVATLRDVTREVQLEEQFRQAQKMEAVGRLAGGVAHDFNNLLTVIHLSTRLLERQLHPRDPLREHVERIQDADQRATALVKQLLAFSRRDMVEPQVLDLNQVLGDLDKMLRRLIGEDIEMNFFPTRDLWSVKIDPTRIEQVVVNLAVNARDAMPTGGKLTFETANVALDAAYAARHLEVEPGEYVLLAVSDTGVGMSEEVKAHLFEPFFTTKEKGKGTGLGLATVFGIVKQNGGHIRVYSEPGQGTTFKIYLPRTAKGALPAATPPPRPAVTRGTETLLLVEDEPMVQAITRDILEAQGYRVLTASDGVEALRVAQGYEEPIHLLLTDVVMPRMSGKALAEQLLAARPELRVLFISGYTDNAIVHHGVLDEGIHFLSKPFEMETLARKVREVLDASARQATDTEDVS